jgi:hypothetical protein
MEKEEIHDMSPEERSEKVRGLLGEIPPSLVRWGIAIIVIIFAALAAALLLIPYPHSGGESILLHLISQ